MLMVSMMCLSSHAGNGFITFAIVPSVVGVPTVLAVLLLLSFMLLLAFLWLRAVMLLLSSLLLLVVGANAAACITVSVKAC
jgi:hypothetical protein